MHENLRGVYPALVTPFKADLSCDYGALARLTAMTREKGVNGFFVCGTSGEVFSLTADEREKALETVLREAGGLPVIAHVGSLDIEEAKRLARHAARAGAAAVAAVPPFYFNHNAAELEAFYREIAAAAGVRLFLYNIPSFTGVHLNKDNCSGLFEAGLVAGVKHSSPNLLDLERMKTAYPNTLILAGLDELFCPSRLMGAEGCVGTGLNYAPELFVEMQRLVDAGDYGKAMVLQRRVNAMGEVLQRVGFVAAVKCILEFQGFPAGSVRGPFLPLSEADRKTVEAAYLLHIKAS